MAELDGKTLVISAVLKTNGKPFRASFVTDDTHLKRNLVAHHLKNLVNTGYVEKQGVVYVVTDVVSLVEMLTSSKVRTELKCPETVSLNKFSPKTLNKLAEVILIARSIDLEGSVEFKARVLDDLQKSIRGLEKLKRKIAQGEISPATARRQIENMAREEYRDNYFNWATVAHGMTLNKDSIWDRIQEVCEDE